MHLDKCAGLSKTAVMAIKEIGANLSLYCNQCVDTGKKDLFVKIASKEISTEAIKAEFTEVKSAVQELKSAVRETFDKTEDAVENRSSHFETLNDSMKDLKKTFAQVVKKPQTIATPPTVISGSMGIRLRGVPECNSEDALQRERYELEQVDKIFKFLRVNCTVTGVRRLGKRVPEQNKIRSIIVNVSNPEDKRLILLSAKNKKNYSCKVFIDRELTKIELDKENASLKRRRELIESGVLIQNLRMRNLKLQQKVGDEWKPVPDHDNDT